MSEIDATISEKNDCAQDSAGFSNTEAFRHSTAGQHVSDTPDTNGSVLHLTRAQVMTKNSWRPFRTTTFERKFWMNVACCIFVYLKPDSAQLRL